MLKVLRDQLPDGKFQDVPKDRSRTMKRIRSRGNKSTEVRLRMALVSAGISGWIMHSEEVEGHPDFCFHDYGVVVFVDGCFWHGCPKCGHVPNTNHEFWRTKLVRRKKKDREVNRKLNKTGYTVVRLWEHQLVDDLAACVRRIQNSTQQTSTK